MKRNIKLFTTFLFFCLTLSFGGGNAESKGDYGTPYNYASALSPVLRAAYPVVPVSVDKYATPVLDDPETPNAWDITLRISSGAVTIPVDVVLVIDQSSSMKENNRIGEAIKSGKMFVRKMLPKGKDTKDVRVALVSYDHQLHYRSNFTNDADFLCSEIDKLTPIWGTHTQAGLHLARKIMSTSHAPKRYIVLMSDGNATQQYGLKNPTQKDFSGRTGNSNDPNDLVIRGGVNYPNSYLADNPDTSLKPSRATWDSKVSKRDLPESRYDYGDIMDPMNFVMFDGTSGPLVYEPKFGSSPSYYYAPTNAAINEAQFAKDDGYEVFTIGYDLGEFHLAIKALELTASSPVSDHFYRATPQELAGAFNNIAEKINKGVQRGSVTDLVAPGYILKNIDQTGDVTRLVKVSHGTVHYDKATNKLTWETGAVLSSSDATLTYRVYADLESVQNDKCIINNTSNRGPDVGGFDTNNSAELTYTNSNGEPNQKKIFPRPTVKPGYGIIKRYYYLVNEDGKPITENGTIVSKLTDATQIHEQDFFMPSGSDHISPKWIKMDKSITDPNNQTFAVTPVSKRIKYGDEYYLLVETSISGSTANEAPVGISWKRPIGIARFAYKKIYNYWMGGTTGHVNEWNISSNWTDNRVPLEGKDVEFATVANNKGNPAKADLHLDNMPQGGTDGRVIGNLINASEKDLVITQNNQLTIKGKVIDNNPSAGTIVVKSAREKPTGTLKFENPDDNRNVNAVVEFYSMAYDCENCGMYRHTWQYFGIPVQELSTFPSSDVPGEEIVNQWVEWVNGNKWQKAPYNPDTELKKFKGYEITNSSKNEPTDVYKIKGKLYVGDADIPLTRTAGVNYMGANLVGNSYTAAIDIKNAIVFPTGVKRTVYLFNTGTRDQWRKLNGSIVSGYQGGQYLAVPVNTAGLGNLPDRIPSMQTFLVLQESDNSSTLKIKYNKLVKNTTVNDGIGNQIVLRSTETNSTDNSEKETPTLAVDVLGCGYADRVLFFSKEGTTDDYDDGWDGHKIAEPGHMQLYAIGRDEEKRFAVSTVPVWSSLTVGMDVPTDGTYVAEFAISGLPSDAELNLTDLTTNTHTKIRNGSSYSFAAKRGDTGARFRISYSGAYLHSTVNPSTVMEVQSGKGQMTIFNNSNETCRISVFDLSGKTVRQTEVSAGWTSVVEDIPAGFYVVKLQGATINQVAKVRIKD